MSLSERPSDPVLKARHSCVFQGCESSDGCFTYQKLDGRIYYNCFVCKRNSLWAKDRLQLMHQFEGNFYDKETLERNDGLILTKPQVSTYGEFIPIRGLSLDTLKKFGVTHNKATGDSYFPLFDYDKEPVAFKKRVKNKSGFPFLFNSGKSRRDCALFGSQLFSGGKYITVTEGEFDALAAFEMSGSTYPVVSVLNGSNSKFTQADIDYLESFERVYVCFDADGPGREGAEHLCQSLSRNKAFVVKLDPSIGKDANDYLLKKKFDEFTKAWWAAKPYAPEDLVLGSDTFGYLDDKDEHASVPYPWDGLNDMVHGIRTQELIVMTAGSGIGKTVFIKEIALNIFEQTSGKIGMLCLEESIQRSVLDFVGMKLEKNLRLPETMVTKEEKEQAWSSLFKVSDDERFIFWNHFGSNHIDNVIRTVRFMSINFGASYIFLDHVSILVSDQAQGDERKNLDAIMTRLRTLVQELDICLFVVSHLKRPDGTPHEEGAVTSLAQLRGSGSIGHLADIALGLERNGQHENPFDRNVTTIRVLKNRFTGETGPACKVVWWRAKNRLEEITRENEEEKRREFYEKAHYVVDETNERDDL